MLALRLLTWNSDPELVQVEMPRPLPGQVVIRVGGAGLCHTDLHLMHDARPGQMAWGPPFTLGHENAGWVHELGAGVTGLEVGEPVAVFGAWGCGSCRRCIVGSENLCEDSRGVRPSGVGGGLGLDGGMAEYMRVPSSRHLVPLPSGLAPDTAAALTDAGLTPYRAIRRSLPKLLPGSTAVVIGIGGLGHLAVQILKALTAARVVAVDRGEQPLVLARSYGADLALLADDACGPAIREVTGGLGADVVLDCVGSDASLSLGASIVGTLGDLTVLGVGGGTLPVGYSTLAREVSMQRSSWGSRPEMVEVLTLAARGLIEPLVSTFSLADSLSAYRQLADGMLVGRGVIIPSS